MKYLKPELNSFGQANKVIQDFTKTVGFMEPILPQTQLNPAYDLAE